MLSGGIVLLIVGALITIVGFRGGLLGFGVALPLGGSIFSQGVMLAIGGAIVNAIREYKDAVLAEIRGEREGLRIGFKSLWDEMDQVRAKTAPPPPVPVYCTTPVNPGGGQLKDTNLSTAEIWPMAPAKQ